MEFVRYRKKSIFVRHTAQQHVGESSSQPEFSKFYVDHREYREEIVKAQVTMENEKESDFKVHQDKNMKFFVTARLIITKGRDLVWGLVIIQAAKQ